MKDYLVKIITEDHGVLGAACITTNLVDNARTMHGTYPTATAALGRALTGCELMASFLDPDQRVAVKFQGNGPLKKIVVEADGTGSVRGYVAVPEVELPPKNGKLDVSGALGWDGLLTVSKDLGLKDLYHGTVRLYSGEIASDLAYYYSESEQIPSAVGLGVFVEPGWNVSAAGGFLVQSLPPSDDSRIDTLISHIDAMESVTSQIRQGKLPEDLLKAIFDGIPYRVIDKRPLAFLCSCSRSRIEQALVTLGHDELKSIIEQKGEIDVSCQFCGKSYVFGQDELKRLLEEIQ